MSITATMIIPSWILIFFDISKPESTYLQYTSVIGTTIETIVGTGSVLRVSIINSNGVRIIREINSGKGGGGFTKLVDMTGATAITIRAREIPIRDQPKMA